MSRRQEKVQDVTESPGCRSSCGSTPPVWPSKPARRPTGLLGAGVPSSGSWLSPAVASEETQGFHS